MTTANNTHSRGGNGKHRAGFLHSALETETSPVRVRRFVLVRHKDVSGVSGVGLVAEGVRFSGGQIVLQWRRPPMAITVFSSVGDLLGVHGHGGDTELVWLDE